VSRFAGAALKDRLGRRCESSRVLRTWPSDARCIQTRYTPGESSLRNRRRDVRRWCGRDAEDSRKPEIEKLRAWIGQPTVEWGFLLVGSANERPEPWSAR
jgi:hypothetical protein